MILTLFNIWVALDKIVTNAHPLLKDYRPEIPLTLFEPLLLKRSRHLDRILLLHQYLCERYTRSSGGSVFTDGIHSDSFPVRFFDESPDLKNLKAEIECSATEERERKRREFEQKQKKLDDLQARRPSDCDRDERGYHSWRRCNRCCIKNEIDRITIDIHEWPIPSDPLAAKVVVFELARPSDYVIWRDITYTLLNDLCQSHRSSDNRRLSPNVTLQDYSGLKRWIKKTGRISLASVDKPFGKSHYSGFGFNGVHLSNILVNHGAHYQLYDSTKSLSASYPFSDLSIRHLCTFQVSVDGPYAKLQPTVSSTEYFSNWIIANQSECPKELNLHEFISFGTLRSGERLQWLNIARELRTRTLTFHREDVYLLLAQCAWQIGTISEQKFISHSDLTLPDFCRVILRELKELVEDIRSNWMEAPAMRSAIVICSRILAVNHDGSVQALGSELMKLARKVICSWLESLSKTPMDMNEDVRRERQLNICELALSFRSTYDVDPQNLVNSMRESTDVSGFIECSIRKFNNIPPLWNNLPRHIQLLLYRDRRLSHSVESFLSEKILRGNMAVSGYRPAGSWDLFKDRWISASTAPSSTLSRQELHLNLLDGSMMVDGKPLKGLPAEFSSHPTFQRIFGSVVFEVASSGIDGFSFVTGNDVKGYPKTHFGMQGEDLVIRTDSGSMQLELIPDYKFIGDIPQLLVQECVHWLNIERQEIEVRPITSLWESSSTIWRLSLCTNGFEMVNTKQSEDKLLDRYSDTFQKVVTQLCPLEHARFITVKVSPALQVTADLPRFRLAFIIDRDGNLACENYPGMHIARSRSIGTFIGLKNMLILESDLPVRPTKILVPSGTIHISRNDYHHVAVTIGVLMEQTCAQFLEYTVRSDLGSLDGDGSIASHFYQAYLHALTSHCLPDPFLGRTGTDESLCLLSSARSYSLQGLQDIDFNIIERIRSLTPQRCFYPQHLKVMQIISWSHQIPFLSQHPLFLAETISILEHYKKLQIFEKEVLLPDILPDQSQQELINRDRLRNQNYFLDYLSFGSWDKDLIYSVPQDLELADEAAAYTVASAIFAVNGTAGSSSICKVRILNVLEDWGIISGSENGLLSLSYKQKYWLYDSRDNHHNDILATGKYWLTIYDLSRDGAQNVEKKKLRLLFSLSALGYSNPTYFDLITVIIDFATNPIFAKISPPDSPSYDLSKGFIPTNDQVSAIINEYPISMSNSPASHIPQRYGESAADYRKRQENQYYSERESGKSNVASNLIRQWPCVDPYYPSNCSHSSYFSDQCMEDVRKLFQSCSRNVKLRDYVEKIQTTLEGRVYRVPLHNQVNLDPGLLVPPKHELYPDADACTSIHVLLRRRSAPQFSPLKSLSARLSLSKRSTKIGKLLGSELEDSANALTNHHDTKGHEDILKGIQDQLSPKSDKEKILSHSGFWPSMTKRALLKLLSHDEKGSLCKSWRQAIAFYGSKLAEHQRMGRVTYYSSLGDRDAAAREMENDCSSFIDLDWLLIQISGNFKARDLQVQMAEKMMEPPQSRNSVFQLNMGEGKTSVIVPMIASTLSNHKRLVRVVVLKALSTQMFQLLIERLAGLANRQIYYLPFSRDLKVDRDVMEVIQSLHQECMENGGILVAQPEHILSFRLMGIDQILHPRIRDLQNSEEPVSQMLVQSHLWLNEYSRDILDESDEILHARYQLIYTVGNPERFEDHPNRWTTVQELFSILMWRIKEIQKYYPSDLELETEHKYPSIFPIIKLKTGTKACDELFNRVVSDILKGKLSNYPFENIPGNIQKIAGFFIQSWDDNELRNEDLECLKSYFGQTSTWKGLLLLRGLIRHGIIAYTLAERRWRVDYGLDKKRTLLAIPYRAKDVPSPRAEFGHPDVAVCLTCLSYYYQGLSMDQLEDCFEILMKSDNPDQEYERWRRDVEAEEVPKRINGINLRDSLQRTGILFPHFTRNKAVIDFFLSEVVFPKYAKQFPHKLSTSGWDLVEKKDNFITGFSGTKDSQHLLPTMISQSDPLGQESTNATVIQYLLQSENYYHCTTDNYKPLPAIEFLKQVVDPSNKIRVLLDVGAQILELSNEEVGRKWLEKVQDSQVEAAVFINEQDQIVVVDRLGIVEPLTSSQYRSQMHKCVIYLDEAHTRGTDLKLPKDFRAAVTLGPKVTKDRLIQGCMRMRKLGRGQSVVLFAPFKIDQQIRQIAGVEGDAHVSMLNVLEWVYSETMDDIERHLPHWIKQGADYIHREKGWNNFRASKFKSIHELEVWRQPEAQTLEEMYGIKSIREASYTGPDFGTYKEEYHQINKKCDQLGFDVSSQNTSRTGVNEEQEREVSNEIEQQRETERPPPIDPADHKIRDGVQKFTETGIIPSRTDDFISLFEYFDPDKTLGSEIWAKGLLSTLDFVHTVKDKPAIGDYMRPVTWIVSGGYLNTDETTPVLVVFSPYEANELRPAIEKSNKLHLHIYAPRVTQAQHSFEDLRFHVIPPLPKSDPPSSYASMIMQLNLFAGQLYLNNWQTYQDLCTFLGLHIARQPNGQCEPDGFVMPEHRKEFCRFEKSPLNMLKQLFAKRRKGNGFSMTHMGRILGGRSLAEEDFKSE
ncbi:hypothetical protein VKT23_020749 [Stygiomarasmius scandens]|uniref:ubiquitinyl hydrolase 1 n=1 Tax=Marasmiellus scandens TaxID=2682957 RepID=A0ABR1IKZ7_9AGAR